MDKVKAIKVLKPLVDSYVDYANISMKEEDDNIVEALEMAIEALKALDVPDTISRQAAIEALARMMPRSYTPDGSHSADEEIFRAQEIFADCIEALEILPSAQPEIIRCKDCKYNVSSHKCLHPESFFLVPDDDFYCGYAERKINDRTG